MENDFPGRLHTQQTALDAYAAASRGTAQRESAASTTRLVTRFKGHRWCARRVEVVPKRWWRRHVHTGGVETELGSAIHRRGKRAMRSGKPAAGNGKRAAGREWWEVQGWRIAAVARRRWAWVRRAWAQVAGGEREPGGGRVTETGGKRQAWRKREPRAARGGSASRCKRQQERWTRVVEGGAGGGLARRSPAGRHRGQGRGCAPELARDLPRRPSCTRSGRRTAGRGLYGEPKADCTWPGRTGGLLGASATGNETAGVRRCAGRGGLTTAAGMAGLKQRSEDRSETCSARHAARLDERAHVQQACIARRAAGGGRHAAETLQRRASGERWGWVKRAGSERQPVKRAATSDQRARALRGRNPDGPVGLARCGRICGVRERR
ncbi:hypothetical protein GGX14DRAFT_398965 [Mycena pura]|uniref:Uncharacterized protein n=1 Tax=Mycena pura TaxID=153505 RepID=A0AAD6V7X6_9AGAR|nr:hypothetical protein GGX14DRAFT_398965 [Mycena pura]